MITTESPGELITLDEMERRYVRQVLNAVGGNKTHAARILGIDRRSLYRRLEDPRHDAKSSDTPTGAHTAGHSRSSPLTPPGPGPNSPNSPNGPNGANEHSAVSPPSAPGAASGHPGEVESS